MRDGHVIFDNVVHVPNVLEKEQFDHPDGHMAKGAFYHFAEVMKRGEEELPPQEVFFQSPPSVEMVRERLFGHGSQIDYAMVQVVPLFSFFGEDPEEAIHRPHRLAQAEPERVIYCGGTDPVFRGLNTALRDIEYQATELGAKSFKFYNAHSRGRSWRMDDPNVAFPMYERMLECGVNIAQVHKGDPQGLEPMTALQAHDLVDAAAEFPQMNFIIHHLAFPYEDETIGIAQRFPNIYLSMSTWINMLTFAPELTAHRWGKALFWAGSHKLLWGTETPLWPSAQRLLDLCWDFQMPEHLMDGYGYPEITDEDRYKMFGGNMLELMGMEDAKPAHASSNGASPVEAPRAVPLPNASRPE